MKKIKKNYLISFIVGILSGLFLVINAIFNAPFIYILITESFEIPYKFNKLISHIVFWSFLFIGCIILFLIYKQTRFKSVITFTLITALIISLILIYMLEQIVFGGKLCFGFTCGIYIGAH